MLTVVLYTTVKYTKQLSMGFQKQEQFKNSNNNYMLLTRDTL